MFAAEPFASEKAVRERVLKPILTNDGPELVLSHLSRKKSDIEALISGAIRTGAPGVKLLLYGPPGTGKTEFVKKLANDLKVDCYEVGYTADGSPLDASRDDRLSYLRLINQLIKPEELKKTQEVFICGTAAEVTPIQSIGDQKFKPGEITKALMQDYDALVRGQGAKAAKAAE